MGSNFFIKTEVLSKQPKLINSWKKEEKMKKKPKKNERKPQKQNPNSCRNTEFTWVGT
jgi:hypothetical protein